MKRNTVNGFTLIELLVVIAIISILAAILFPVFAMARAKARQATCTSNMKQIGTAVMMYTQDYDETMPVSALPHLADGIPTMWSGRDVTGPYIKSSKIFQCPEDLSTVFDSYNSFMAPERVNRGSLSYAINDLMPNRDAFGVHQPVGAFQFSFNSPTSTLPGMRYPADLIMFTDGLRQIETLHQQDERLADSEIAYWSYGVAPIDYAIIYESDIRRLAADNEPHKVWTRHSGGTNIAFADSHVKWMKPSQLVDGKRWVAGWPE